MSPARVAFGGYAGQCARTASQRHDIDVQVVRHPASKDVDRWIATGKFHLFTVRGDTEGLGILTKRWVVNRTRAWNEARGVS